MLNIYETVIKRVGCQLDSFYLGIFAGFGRYLGRCRPF